MWSFFQDGKKNIALLVIGSLFGLIGPWLVNGVLGSLQERATFPMLQAQIERVREDAIHVPCGPEVIAYQPVILKVVEWNVRIVHEHQANALWYADVFSTDRWNAVRPIPLPCEDE